MRSRHVCLLAAAAAVMAACNAEKAAPKPTGPITVKFSTPVFDTTDTVKGRLIMDGTDTVSLPYDSLTNVTRGTHSFAVRLNIDYLTSTFSQTLDPNTSVQLVRVLQGGSCRLYFYDSNFCAGHNLIFWSQHARPICPANDFGEFCSELPDRFTIGATWPSDTVANQANEYISNGKLLIAAIAGAGSVTPGDTLAMSFDYAGDYSPATRLHVNSGDSSRYQVENWTDARHVPLFPNDLPILDKTDRVGDNFGLAVRTTYYQPTSQPNALFIRFDIQNISDNPEYHRVHPEEPVAGHTINNIYLSPVIDPDIGGVALNEHLDDQGTMYPEDSLVVAYDRVFNVGSFSTAYATQPGMVGLQLIDGPPGTGAHGLLFSTGTADTLRFVSAAFEAEAYRFLAGGNAGSVSGCTQNTYAFVCIPETGQFDLRVGWSVGPIASLAPGQTTSLTVAIEFAIPKNGTYVNGNEVMPQNDMLGTTTRKIDSIGANLKALAASAKTVTVDGTPFLSLRRP
jgi:hypothetical protein